MIKTITLACVVLLFCKIGFAQNSATNAVNFIPPQYKSIDFKLGSTIQAVISPNILYQHNVKKHLAVVSYTELGFQPFGNPLFSQSNVENIRISHFNIIEAVGIGVTLGKKRFNNNVFIVGGGRYLYEKITLNNRNFNNPSYSISKLYPEVGLLYNLKIGKKKMYYTAQLYVPIYPFVEFKTFDKVLVSTLSVGVGFKLN
jgi:hypothetical protein